MSSTGYELILAQFPEKCRGVGGSGEPCFRVEAQALWLDSCVRHNEVTLEVAISKAGEIALYSDKGFVDCGGQKMREDTGCFGASYDCGAFQGIIN